jgi:hypothetical protein
MELEHVDVDDLITYIFLKTKDEQINYMIKQYEKQLILCKLDKKRFEKGLHRFYLDMLQYIKDNKLYKKFFELVYINYVNLNSKEMNTKITNAYQDILMQQNAYFGGSTEKVVCGVTSEDKLLLINEIGRGLTEINAHMHEMVMHPDKFKRESMYPLFKKYGYDVNDFLDIRRVITYDQVATNMLFQMAYFLNEDNQNLVPTKFKDGNDLLIVPSIFWDTENIELLQKKLMERQIMLPTTGVYIKLFDCGEIAEIYMVEQIVNDDVILLYKVTNIDGESTIGYHDTRNELFYSMWKDSSAEVQCHDVLQNIVLQHYVYLTCAMTKDEVAQLYKFKESKEINVRTFEPTAYYETKEKIKTTKGETVHTRHFDKKQYISDLADVEPFLRNLPFGQQASEEARQMAERLGITLPNGKTFVKGFQKKVYKKE